MTSTSPNDVHIPKCRHTKPLQALQKVVIYLILSEYNNEQSDMLARTKGDTNLSKLPYYQLVLQLFENLSLSSFSLNFIMKS